MIKKNNKFVTKTFLNFKKSIRCFNPLQKRTILGKIHFVRLLNNLLFIDFGFKQEVECFTHELNLRIPNKLSLKEKCNYIKSASFIEFKIIFLQSFFFNKILIKKIQKIMNLNAFRDIFYIDIKKNRYRKKRRQLKRKVLIKGRFFNPIRGGFAIGVFGHIVFLPLSHAVFKCFGQLTLFYFLFIDFEKRNIIVSQKKITSLLKKQLEKLGSRFIIKKLYNR